MAKIIAGVIVEKSQSLTLEEFCRATHTQPDLILQMIEYQLIQPEGETPSNFRFDSVSLRRGRIAASFYHDLEVNMAGIALALDLLEKIELLQQKLDILEKNPSQQTDL